MFLSLMRGRVARLLDVSGRWTQSQSQSQGWKKATCRQKWPNFGSYRPYLQLIGGPESWTQPTFPDGVR